MSYRKIFWGVILVMIGTLFILKNIGMIYFDWLTIWRLWPLILILWGISLIPVKDYLKLIFSVLAIAISIFLVNRYDKTGYYSFGWRDSDREYRHSWRDDSNWDDSEQTQELYQEYDSAISRVELKLEAAAGDFRLNDTAPSDKLLTFFKQGTVGNYSMTSRDDSSKMFIELKINESNIRFKNKGNRVKLGLHTQPVWDFDFDIGAASIDFDLSNYKVGHLDLDGGASSIDLKLGDLNDYTSVSIDAGAASIDVRLPESVGAQLKTETALTSRNFPGFKKIRNGLYRTDNYESAVKKIDLEIDAAVSSLNVIRYNADGE
ncbi:hypothetical protein DSECCO2_365050 [anaerobic digester metagenome]